MPGPPLATASVEGSLAVVTGGASGIGLAVTRRLLKNGWAVAAIDQDADALRTLHEAHPTAMVLPLLVDVRVEEQVAHAVEAACERFGPVRALCTCAAVKQRAAVDATTLSQWSSVIDTNLTGTFLFVRAVVGVMREAKAGRIVTVASASAYAEGNASAYAASKGGVIAFTRSLALELAPDHVAVNCVVPGLTATPMVTYTPEELAERGRTNVTGRPNGPGDVARGVAFLLSPEAATISGAVVDIGQVHGRFAGL